MSLFHLVDFVLKVDDRHPANIARWMFIPIWSRAGGIIPTNAFIE